MMRSSCYLGLFLALTSGCSCDESTEPVAGGGTGGVGGIGGAGGGAGGSGGSGGASLVFSQARLDALYANPEVYPTIPVRVRAAASVDAVLVRLEDQSFQATGPDAAGEWLAEVDISGLTPGLVTLTAEAEGITTDVDLVLGTEGVMITEFQTDGSGTGPRLFSTDASLSLVYAKREPEHAVLLLTLDGGLRPVGEPVTLLGSPAAPLYAESLVVGDRVGILYQEQGTPYANYFTVVGLDGTELVAPIALDPAGASTARGGALTYDGEAFVAVFRVIGATQKDILWVRVNPETGEVAGPTVIASAGAGLPIVDFIPFSPLSIAPMEGSTLVAFEGEVPIPSLGLDIPHSHYVTVQADGAASPPVRFEQDDFTFHYEARLFTVQDKLVSLWSSGDLTDETIPIPTDFRTKVLGADGEFPSGDGNMVLDAPDDRAEPFMLSHSHHHAVLAWTDHRSYTEEGIQNGRIELFTASVSDALEADEPVIFPHARFIATTGELNAAPANPSGSNVVLTWVDERHGGGVTDPRPEVFLETAWY